MMLPTDNRMTLADLLSMQQDDSDPSVQYSTGQPSLSSLTRGRTEEEINKLLSVMQMRTPGFDPNFMSGKPYTPPQAMPQNYVQRGNNAPIDMDQRQPMPQNYIQRGNNAPIDLGQSRRQHDVFADGPQVLSRQQQPDGTFLVTKRVASMDPEGRQSADVRQYIETPDYLNPAKLKEMQFKLAMQKLSEGDIDLQTKKAQLAELMGIDPSAGVRSEVYSIETPPTFPVGQSPQLAVNQASIAHPERQKFLSRRFGQAPANYRWDEQGNAVPIPGVEPNLTDTQGNALAFAMKAQNALDQKAKAVDSEGKPYNLGFGEQVLSKAPFGVGQGFLEGPAQRFVNAEKNFIAAVLRKESGAAISQGEYDEYGPAFFDRPGDSPGLLRDKAIARQTALESLKAQAGNQYDRLAKKAMDNVTAAVPPKAESSAPVKISSDADYAALPSGTTFVGPDGKTRRKP